MASRRLAVEAITLDFGNTLVMVDRASLRGVVEDTAGELRTRGLVHDQPGFLVAWAEERDRQFREEVPEFREVDIDQRAIRVLARLRGMAPPAREARWDQEAARAHSSDAEIELVVEAYSAAFIRRMAPVPDAAATLRTLAARGFALAILSNWPLARTVDRFAEANGWLPYLQAVVVSHRVGTIKPHPSIFRAAETALGIHPESRSRILHVGDDWAADVVGANGAGWRTAYLRGKQADTPLPTSEPGDHLPVGGRDVRADLEIDDLAELDDLVERAPATAAP